AESGLPASRGNASSPPVSAVRPTSAIRPSATSLDVEPSARIDPLPPPDPVADPDLLDPQLPFRLEQVVPDARLAFRLLDSDKRIGGRQHARRRTGVPRPAAATAMTPAVVNIGRLLNGNEPVDRDALGVRLPQRGNLLENLESPPAEARGQLALAPGFGPFGEADEAVDDPRRAMAVLTAVLSNSRRIVRDPAGIGLRMLVERRFHEQHPIGPFNAFEAALDCRERAAVVASPRIGRPAGRHRIRHRDYLPVIGEVEHVVIALPAHFQCPALLIDGVLASDREGLVALQPRNGNEAFEHVGEKEAHPDARPDLPPPENVDAVVPVAGAQE